MLRLPQLNAEIDTMVSPKDLQKEIMEDYKEIEAIFTGESAKLIFKNQYENFYNVLMKNWDKETTMAKKFVI